MINNLKVGDILEGSRCAISLQKIMLFKVISFEIHDRNGSIQFKTNLLRIEDKETHTGIYLFPSIDNWRVIKRNGNTICEQCNVRK